MILTTTEAIHTLWGAIAVKQVEVCAVPLRRPLPADVFYSDGEVFARAGEIVAPCQLELEKDRLSDGLYVGDDWPLGDEETSDPPNGISVQSLKVGTNLSNNVSDENGVLLLRAGTEITQGFVDRLRVRGICQVHCDRGDSKRLSKPRDNRRTAVKLTERTRQFDEKITQCRFDVELPRNRRTGEAHLELAQLREELDQARRVHNDSVDTYAQLATDVINGKSVALGASVSSLGKLMEMLRRDRRLGLLTMSMQTQPDDYLFKHGVNVAILTMCVGLYLGFGEEDVVHAGLGAMCHDLGMLSVPESLRLAPRARSQVARFEIELHPIYTLNALDRLRSVPEIAMLVAYQVHERYDGHGYPRGRSYLFTHPLSRIEAVTDAYVRWNSWRPHRPAISPYMSMCRILREAPTGRFDKEIIRAFLDCMSLFPIGSSVLLSNDTPAQVMRSNLAEHTRPVVLLTGQDGIETDEEVDLATTASLHIVGEWGNSPASASS